jgi:hypothetical protein
MRCEPGRRRGSRATADSGKPEHAYADALPDCNTHVSMNADARHSLGLLRKQQRLQPHQGHRVRRRRGRNLTCDPHAQAGLEDAHACGGTVIPCVACYHALLTAVLDPGVGLIRSAYASMQEPAWETFVASAPECAAHARSDAFACLQHMPLNMSELMTAMGMAVLMLPTEEHAFQWARRCVPAPGIANTDQRTVVTDPVHHELQQGRRHCVRRRTAVGVDGQHADRPAVEVYIIT